MVKNEFEQIKKELKVIIKDSIKELPTRKEVKEIVKQEVELIVDKKVDNLALMVAKGFAENTQQHLAMNSRIGNIQSELYDVHAKVDGLSNQSIHYDTEIRKIRQ